MTVNTEIDLEKKGDDTVKLDAGVSVSKPNVRADLRKPFYAWVYPGKAG